MYQQLPDFNGQPAQAIKRIADNATIPFDPANTDYQAYLAWVAEGNVADPVPAPTTAELAAQVRAERDRLLTGSDWTQVADAPVDKAAWAAYRQALRDIPQQDGFPGSVTWPSAPA